MQRFSTRFNCFTWQTIATCMHCCQVMNGRPLEGMIAATSIFFPVYWCSHQRNLPPALQPSGLSNWVLMHWPGYRAFFYCCSAVIRGKIVTSERLYAFRVLPAGLATISWQRLCHWCRGAQWRTLRPLLTNDRIHWRLLVPWYLQVRSKLRLVCIGNSDDGYLIGT